MLRCWKKLKRSQNPADCNHTNKGVYKTTQRLHPKLSMEFYCSPLITTASVPTLAVLVSQLKEVTHPEVPHMALKTCVVFVPRITEVPQIAEVRFNRMFPPQTMLFMPAETIVFISDDSNPFISLPFSAPLSLLLSLKSYGAGFRGVCSRSPDHISAPDYV